MQIQHSSTSLHPPPISSLTAKMLASYDSDEALSKTLNPGEALTRHMQTLESRDFRLSRAKTEYMECKFSKQGIQDYSNISL